MKRIITNVTFTDYINCPFKVFLKISEKKGRKTDFEIMEEQVASEYRIATAFHLQSKWNNHKVLMDSNLSQLIKGNYEKGINIREESENYDILYDGIIKERTQKEEFIPIIFINKHNLTIKEKLYLGFIGFSLGSIIKRMPSYGKILHGPEHSSLKLKLNKLIPRVRPIIEEIKSIFKNQNFPKININKHCQVCEFGNECLKTAKKTDDLSLLSGLDSKKIKKLNKKGIFTINQLSYTFKPRRKRKKIRHFQNPFRPELKALALRENKVHVYITPTISNCDTEIYLDIESLPDYNFYYLVGLVVNHKGISTYYSFWANSKEQEHEIFCNLLNVLKEYTNYVIYHYGQFEIRYLKQMMKMLNETERKKVDKVLDRCCNTLSFFHSNVYVPTYTNSLKDIAKYLGFKWNNEESSGIQSIIWRMEWESNKTKEIKSTLIKYNMDDCYALKMVKDFIHLISKNEESTKHQNTDVVFHRDLKSTSPFKFLIKEYANPAIENIHKYSLFDYQRQRVFVRTDDFVRKTVKSESKKRKIVQRPNVTKSVSARKCIRCKSRNISIQKPISKQILDLKFTNSGIKRWITKFSSNEYQCKDCFKIWRPVRYINGSKSNVPKGYRKCHTKYGHMIKSWVIFQYIVNKQSFRRIDSNLYEYFKLSIDKSTLHEFKRYIVKYYEPTYKLLLQKILNSDILYVDETPLKMKQENGYAWVFTNNREVISIYQPTRDGKFLKDLLCDYNGVLVSDFYTAYDSLKCIHQKCLIHLIRNMNDDLLKNPFNEEIKFVTQNFTNLMQRIVKTIDKFGLRKERLKKYTKDVEKLFNRIAKYNFKTEVGIYYQERFRKNRDRLFEFIKHDNVSWNNNNAEKAIKLLATHTNMKIILFSEPRMREYLQIMSIYQSCVYNNVSFLKFLLSTEKEIDSYIEDNL